MTVPCHNDLLAENFLDDGQRVRIIDHEYSIRDGSSPPDFDHWSRGMQKYDRAVAEFDGPDLEHLLAAARQADSLEAP